MREPGRRSFASVSCGLLLVLAGVGGAFDATAADAHATGQGKPATAATRAANAAVLRSLPFQDRADFDDAQRGLIARPERLTITDANGKVVWDLEAYKRFISLDAPAPDTVNPSLWRNAQLNMQYGLFKVTDRVYQVRGYDISNITFVQGDSGWIVFDPLISVETAKAAYGLVSAHLGQKPVRAVVYSHTHVDHYGGVRALVTQADVDAGKVQILAPEGFTEHAIGENVIAGNAMSRRAIYMFGALLPRDPTGGVTSGLGQTVSGGTVTLILPTDTIRRTGESRTIDGVEMVFQMTPGTEAPAEMNTWFPQFKAMWMAENTTNTLHNVLTLRGALVRDALRWAGFIDETIELYGAGAEVKFQSHHWPMWGNARIVDYLKKQRDLYKYVHDQSVRLMNQGYVASEIAGTLEFPPEIDRYWPNRGYYGTLRHNSRAVYQRYMGWYDGNPSSLDELPPEPAAKKYLEYMGGEAAVLERARRDFANGEYRWVATALRHVVFANPASVEGKALLADAYEQLGYQAESGPWRSIYLQGATELRNGVPKGGAVATASPDILAAMPPELLFDYMAVRLNGPKAAGRKITVNFDFTDLARQYAVTIENGVLNHAPALEPGADATLTIAKRELDKIQLKQLTMQQALAAGTARLDGRAAAFGELMALLDDFPFWFNIVTP